MKSQKEPPKQAARLLESLSTRFGLQEIGGDLFELYYKRVNEGNTRKAKFLFCIETLRAVPSMWFTYRRRKKKQPLFRSNMIFSNITIGFRHMLKRPGHSFITIVGLALGILVCQLIFDYVRFERSFDRYNANASRIAMMQYHFKTVDIDSKSPAVPYFIGPKLAREYSEVESQTRILPAYGSRVMTIGDKMFEESNFAFADSTLFDVLTFKLLQGNPKDLLRRPNTAVLTRQAAYKFFGSENPIGKTVLYNNTREYEVTGVVEDMPYNSHIRFDYFFSLTSLGIPNNEQFDSPNFITYLLMAQGSDIKTFEQKLNADWRDRMGESLSLPIIPLTNAHFDTSTSGYGSHIKITDASYLLTFSVVAVLILLIAGINYVNLITARANERGREVGIRKISGANNRQLFGQFMIDSALHVLPAIGLALILFFLVAPLSNQFLGIAHGPVTLRNSLPVIELAAIILVVITLAAGFYPSVIMARLRPASVLKGKFSTSRTSLTFQKGLVVFQFGVSILLIICAAVVSGQLTFMQNKKLGFDKDHVLVLPADAKILDAYNAFETELKKLAGVVNVTPVSASPTDIVIGNGMRLSDSEADQQYVSVGGLHGSDSFLQTLDIELVAGRNFTPHKDIMKDSGAFEFIVNQTFLTKFGLSEAETLGRKVNLGGPGEIIGIMHDFHTGSLRQKIEPIVMFAKPHPYIGIGKFLVKVGPGDMEEHLADLQKVWRNFAPHRPFTYSFLDENYNSLYQTERKINVLAKISSGLTIIIACLGILGLASYMATQRTKEIGIRKVLGASVPTIMVLLSRDFLVLIGIAFALAAPLAFYVGSDWLTSFEYRAPIRVSYFLVAAIMVFGFAILTIGYHTIKAAVVNPATSLRTE